MSWLFFLHAFECLYTLFSSALKSVFLTGTKGINTYILYALAYCYKHKYHPSLSGVFLWNPKVLTLVTTDIHRTMNLWPARSNGRGKETPCMHCTLICDSLACSCFHSKCAGASLDTARPWFSTASGEQLPEPEPLALTGFSATFCSQS